MANEHILDQDICTIADSLRSGEISVVALMDEVKKRHADYGESLNAYK